MNIATPYYCIDEVCIKNNMGKIKTLHELSGAQSLLALKCFATWAAFPFMKEACVGTTSSSLFEARLGYEEFGGETHAFSVAYSREDIAELKTFSDKIIFNSLSQLQRFVDACHGIPLGLRINPGISYSDFDLADPARPYSRLGVNSLEDALAVKQHISGVMFHYNCENNNLDIFEQQLSDIADEWAPLLNSMEWVSLGGGVEFTRDDFALERFAVILRKFRERFGVELYLEPGEAAITGAATLETTVLDIVENEKKIAIVDSSIEAHMLDLLIYRENAHIDTEGEFSYQIAGKTCLAGDIFGEFHFPKPLQVGNRISIADAAGYTMVKKNWFNGVGMPAIVIRREDGTEELVRSFTYEDYKRSLS